MIEQEDTLEVPLAENHPSDVGVNTLIEAYGLMRTAFEMSRLFEEHKKICSKYVHATSRGHEAIQLAASMQLKPQDFLSPYYRDDAMLLGIGLSPYEIMLSMFAKKDDECSGGRHYYGHPSLKRDDMPKIIFQSSSTGMQAIPTTGIAQGIKYKEETGIANYKAGEANPVVICSLGDGAITEGEVSEAFQMAVLHQYPIIYLIQDNEWDISAKASEIRAMDAPEFARGFKGMEVRSIDGSNFIESYKTLQEVIGIVRKERRPFMVHAKVPLLNHHTSGVRSEWYRHDMEEHKKRDPLPKLKGNLQKINIKEKTILEIEEQVRAIVEKDFNDAMNAEEPDVADLEKHAFAPTPVTEEKGVRTPADGKEVVMVDAALHAIDEIMKEHPEALLYGQDVGGELGGVFREAALLAKRYGDKRVFNTPIQEAYIIGSTVGMSATGLRPFVEVQFADYIWPGLNQMYSELSRSYYLSNGKWNVSSVVRVPIGAYGSGGPYHSSSVESVVLQIKGVKVAYPSNAADLKGLLKAAFYDPNPVVMFEHKGLYWSKVPGSKRARTIEPDKDYILPFGKANIPLPASEEQLEIGNTVTVITYGMGVHWAMNAAEAFPGSVEVVDLRTLNPLDLDTVYASVKQHGKCLVLTEETVTNSFAESLAGRIARDCFEFLDAPVQIMGAINTPAIPLNSTLEHAMLPSNEKVAEKIGELLEY